MSPAVDELRGEALRDADLPLTRDPSARQPPLDLLLDPEDTELFRGRWRDLHGAFVDEPQRVLAGADELVTELLHRLGQTFAADRAALEAQWRAGGDAAIEDLRLAVQRFQLFFERVLVA
jgi:hypothetical protein